MVDTTSQEIKKILGNTGKWKMSSSGSEDIGRDFMWDYETEDTSARTEIKLRIPELTLFGKKRDNRAKYFVTFRKFSPFKEISDESSETVLSKHKKYAFNNLIDATRKVKALIKQYPRG